jgi:hypothetical protein
LQKQNISVTETPNQKVQITVRAVALDFRIAGWLEKQQETMRRIFAHKKRKLPEIERFYLEFQEVLQEHIKDRHYRELINREMVAFGPDK